MRVLIACEHTGAVRDAFIRAGHDAMSCDLLDTEAPGPHYMGDVRDVLNNGWDLMVAHPPCTYLSVSGLHWNGRVPGRSQKTEEGLDFVRLLMFCDIPKIAIENPVSCSAPGYASQIKSFSLGSLGTRKARQHAYG